MCESSLGTKIHITSSTCTFKKADNLQNNINIYIVKLNNIHQPNYSTDIHVASLKCKTRKIFCFLNTQGSLSATL